MPPRRSSHREPRHNTIGLKTLADKMVGDNIGLQRTYNVRRMLAEDNGNPQSGERMASARLFTLPDTEFIELLGTAFDDEFKILAEATGTTVEKGSGNVIGGYGPNEDQSPSQLLFNGACHSEVDRTMVGILCMKWILTNKYDKFVAHQPKPVKLSKAEFGELRTLFMDTFGDTSSSYMLIVSMIVNDLGKNEKLREDLRDRVQADDFNPDETELAAEISSRWKTMNHDEVILFATHLDMIDLVNEFDQDRRKQLELGIRFGGALNLGQLAQAENVPGSLKGIADMMSEHQGAFPFKFLEVVLDVAGAQGHVDSRCSKSWISPVNQAYENSRQCIVKVIDGQMSEHAAYDGILEHRAELLHKKGWKKLEINGSEPGQRSRNRALLRIITMARADNKEKAQQLEDVLDSLPTKRIEPPLLNFLNRPIENVRQAVIDGLTVDGLDDGIAIIPYYAPGLLAEIARVLKTESEEHQRKGMAAFMRLMARAFVGTHSKATAKASCVVECDLSFAQGVIRGDEFLHDPNVLDQLQRGEDIYSHDIDGLMKDVYDIRPLSRRESALRSPTAS